MARREDRQKRDVHGWSVLDKPIGMTSTHAVAVIKRLFSANAPGTPVRSIRWPPAVCRSLLAKQPKPFRSCRRSKDLCLRCAGARNATPTMPKAASST